MAFFFQAEDGIRDYDVTGVQTCALPILYVGHGAVVGHSAGVPDAGAVVLGSCLALAEMQVRSEERRVGEECRSRLSPYHYNKKVHNH